MQDFHFNFLVLQCTRKKVLEHRHIHTRACKFHTCILLLSLVSPPNALRVASKWAILGRWHVACWARGTADSLRFLDFHGA